MIPHHPSVIVYRLPGQQARCFSVKPASHAANVEKMRALHAASLREVAALTGQGDSTDMQEAPEIAVSEASTAQLPLAPEVRAASAQSDTNP